MRSLATGARADSPCASIHVIRNWPGKARAAPISSFAPQSFDQRGGLLVSVIGGRRGAGEGGRAIAASELGQREVVLYLAPDQGASRQRECAAKVGHGLVVPPLRVGQGRPVHVCGRQV